MADATAIMSSSESPVSTTHTALSFATTKACVCRGVLMTLCHGHTVQGHNVTAIPYLMDRDVKLLFATQPLVWKVLLLQVCALFLYQYMWQQEDTDSTLVVRFLCSQRRTLRIQFPIQHRNPLLIGRRACSLASCLHFPFDVALGPRVRSRSRGHVGPPAMLGC